MSKVCTVEEAISLIKAKEKKDGKRTVNRFNKRNFNILMTAMINDPTFSTEVVKRTRGKEITYEDVMVTRGFRKWCKHLLEKAGLDRLDAERVMTPEFIIDSVDGLYDFFTTAIYLYMESGNQFSLPNKRDFQGSIYLSEKPEEEKSFEARNPKDGSVIGVFETKKKPHKVLKSRSTCPSYLKTKKKIK